MSSSGLVIGRFCVQKRQKRMKRWNLSQKQEKNHTVSFIIKYTVDKVRRAKSENN